MPDFEKMRREAAKTGVAMREFAFQVIEQLERLEEEKRQLTQLPVPALFLPRNKWPVTPAARAAQEQERRVRGG